MRARLLILAERIDALTLRERVMVFAAAAASIVFVAYYMALSPMYRKQAALRTEIAQQQNNLAGIDAEITAKAQAFAVDPDAAMRAHLAAVEAETAQLGTSLRTMEKGLVPPERVAPLLETILKSNGRLRLLSMTTLPVDSLGSPAARAQAATADAGKAAGPVPAAAVQPALLYRHGVQVEVRGNYLDMIGYMGALEALPTQLFWGKAQLEVEEYPNARLGLTLYTLSLDPKWMKL